jgi:hypothetical protein
LYVGPDSPALAFQFDANEVPQIPLADYLVSLFENLCEEGFGHQYILVPFAYILRLQNTKSDLRLNKLNLHK